MKKVLPLLSTTTHVPEPSWGGWNALLEEVHVEMASEHAAEVISRSRSILERVFSSTMVSGGTGGADHCSPLRRRRSMHAQL
jgi:hypothetical protein